MIRAFNATDKIYSSNGDAVIAATKARVKNKDNGDFILELICGSEYNDYIQANNIIVAPTPQGDQAFRVRQVEKRGNRIEAKCYHVFYDAENYIIADSYAYNMTAKQALEHFNTATDNTSPFTVDSDITSINNLRIVRGSLAEAVISVIERWGGHLYRDNFNVSVKSILGTDNGITIEYKKNLKELTASYDWSGVITKLLPVGKDGILIDGLYVSSATQYDIPFTKTVSFEQEIEREDYASDEAYIAALKADLRAQAQRYVNLACVPNINYTLKGNPEKVTDIGDVIEVKDARIGVNVLTKVIAYEYDAIANKYVSLEFGNFTPKLSSLMSDIKSETATQIASATSNINIEVNAIENAVTILNSSINQLENGKQNKLTAGENIVINNDIISAKSINVLYGTDAPENTSGNNKDFYLKLVNTGGVLSLDKFHNENSTEQNPIYLTDFTATSRNEYSFIIHGCPDNQGHGEWCYFELDGLIEGNTYGLTFKMQFNSGATFPWSYYDYVETCGKKINFQKDSALHTYSCTFTYEAGGQMFFNFPAINDNVNFTATITDMVITGDFVPKDIAEIYNKHEDTWRKYTPPASASALSELTDVELTNLTDKDIIEWDEIAEKWKNVANSGGGGGTGGSSVYSEKELYKASNNTFANIQVDFTKDYDAYIFYCNDVITQKAESYFYTKSEIKDAIANNLVISMYPYGAAGYCQYNISDSGLTTVDNRGRFILYKIVGLKFGTLSPIIYSEEEREVGVWIDNKPLYAKTISHDTAMTNRAWTQLINDSNIDIKLYDGCIYLDGYPYTYINYHRGVSQSEYSCGAIFNNGHGFQIYPSIDGATITCKVTLYYTKTTDTAGSGSYNTLGVPNVHYKDDWHVVGTWWNGKPIYEKTFHYTTANLPTDRMTIEKIYNFDELVGIDGYFGYQDYSNDYRNYKLGEAPPQLTNKAIYLLCEGNDQVNDIQDLDFNFNGLDRNKVVYISATVRITKTTD